MILNPHRRNLLPVLILALCLSLVPGKASARAYDQDLTGSVSRAASTSLPGDRGHVIGVVAAGTFSFPVVQQEAEGSVSVTSDRNEVTQFGMAEDLGNIGLLAHNYLAGKRFFQLEVGQRIFLIYSSGQVESFIVTRVFKYQALTPRSPYSEFRELGGDAILSAEEMFYKAYGGGFHVTFQTCIAQDGDSSWGRLFVIAEPASAG